MAVSTGCLWKAEVNICLGLQLTWQKRISQRKGVINWTSLMSWLIHTVPNPNDNVSEKFTNFQVSATDKDLITISYCVFTSSHYRYRCQWERNQSLSVCVSQSSRSVWVPSHGQLCSFPSPPSQPPLSSWSTAAPLFFYREATALCHRCKPLLYLFMHLVIFINVSHCCLKAWCRFMNRLFSWISLLLYMCSYWPGQEWLWMWSTNL